ncbi:MAG: HK97 family phage prohead protease [Proteobacteria bacterium]|nr:HK97 family phage prohead protease [Pseudomonadota bacterium]
MRALASQRRLEGYAATFGSEARLGDIVETVEPGAFRAALAGDILALMDHDPGRVLASMHCPRASQGHHATHGGTGNAQQNDEIGKRPFEGR